MELNKAAIYLVALLVKLNNLNYIPCTIICTRNISESIILNFFNFSFRIITYCIIYHVIYSSVPLKHNYLFKTLYANYYQRNSAPANTSLYF